MIKWHSVEKEGLPPEHDTMFAKLYGTEKWHKGMFRKTSKDVIVTLKTEKGETLVSIAHTLDGVWKIKFSWKDLKVIAWAEMPEPWEGE